MQLSLESLLEASPRCIMLIYSRPIKREVLFPSALFSDENTYKLLFIHRELAEQKSSFLQCTGEMLNAAIVFFLFFPANHFVNSFFSWCSIFQPNKSHPTFTSLPTRCIMFKMPFVCMRISLRRSLVEYLSVFFCCKKTKGHSSSCQHHLFHRAMRGVL